MIVDVLHIRPVLRLGFPFDAEPQRFRVKLISQDL
jgi:hypothetical protein